MEKEYSIGLDIGTNSVGWAVIGDDYNVIKKGKHPLWGVRLFEEASSAAERRMKRSNRRRYARRKERINLLREEFKDEIEKVDSKFFDMLDESFYVNWDDKKTIKIDKEYKEIASEYYKKYPTIYHLRNHLTNTKDKEDIRLVYLAIHHILKYRGNFLKEGINFSISDINLEEDINNLVSSINSCNQLAVGIGDIDVNLVANILMNSNKTDKKRELNKILEDGCFIKEGFDFELKSFISQLCTSLVGNKADLAKMFAVELADNIKLSFSLDGDEYDKNYEVIERYFGDFIEIIAAIKYLFDDVYLKKLFNEEGVTSISTAMIKRYDKHRKDLDLLKKVFRGTEEYRVLFKEKNKKQRGGLYGKYLSKDGLSNSEFIKEIEKLGEKLIDEKRTLYEAELQPLLNDNFMPLISSIENGKYNYQLNEDELVKIIENQGQFYPFLLEKIDGEYKIQKILKFKIPYYVGPLGNDHNKQYKNHWLIRNEGYEKVKVTPYNFKDVVNRNATAEQFIMRMVSNCTYLMGEKAMPANSILYSEYKVLNELKQIKIGNTPIDKTLQKFIYENLFLKSDGRVSDKKFKQFLLLNRDKFNYEDGIEVSGYSAPNGFANNMKSYSDFFGNDGVFKNTPYTIDNAEEIIEWITIFEDKSILKEKIIEKYNLLPDNAINKLLSLKYSGWSALSKKLLTEIITYDKDMQMKSSIIDIMRYTEANFMQIVSRKDVKAEIDRLNELILNKNTNISDIVYDLATSPANKRGILQAIKIVKAITKKMGYEPTNICIEMARNEDQKKRTDSRKDRIKNLYATFKTKIIDSSEKEMLKKVSNEFNEYDNDDLKNKMLFLYFMQCGKCMYSGKPLNISTLEQDCEIDHIIPQSLIKDDSFDNTVLVYKEYNQIKSGSPVVPKEFRGNCNNLWARFKELGFISSKKYDRLMRYQYSESDIQGFINRQLVETRQITKHVANILNNIYKNTEVIYLHAELSNQYRKRYEYFKFRDLNDFHHAHDAYLSAVLGIYKKKYFNTKIDPSKTADVSMLMKELRDSGTKHTMHYGYIVNSLDNEHGNRFTTCSIEEIQLINDTVFNNMYRNDILVSYKTFEYDKDFTDETICGKKEPASVKIPLKKGLNPEYYGFKTGIKYSYYTIIKQKDKSYIFPLPIHLKDEDSQKEHFAKLLKCKIDDITLTNKKILKNTIAYIGDDKVQLVAGYADKVEIKSVKQLCFKKDVAIRNKYLLNHILNNGRLDITENSVIIGCEELLDSLKKFGSRIIILQTAANKLIHNDPHKLTIDELESNVIFHIQVLKSKSNNINQIVRSKLTDITFEYTDILGFHKRRIHIDDIGK